MPNAAVSTTAPATPTRKEPVQRVSQAATNAPIIAADGAHIVVLDRVLVGVELEGAAHRVEPGVSHRPAQGFLVGEVALGGANRRVDQLGVVVALRRVQ